MIMMIPDIENTVIYSPFYVRDFILVSWILLDAQLETAFGFRVLWLLVVFLCFD